MAKRNIQRILVCMLLLVVYKLDEAVAGFVRTQGTKFILDGHPFYVNGFNAYWMHYMSVDPANRAKVSSLMQQAAGLGLTVARTWAYNDGGYNAIQIRPGVYDETSFRGLDFVVSEAQKHGLRLLLCLNNNYASYGGKPKYVEWARSAGVQVYSEDAFYSDPTIKGYYKNYIKTVLSRVNTITGVRYSDDPTVFGWELMNEARCQSDPSGNTLEAWIREMASFVKSIDHNHMLEIGLEGFYSSKNPKRVIPSSWTQNLGTDFIRHNQIPGVDFATVHSYPDLWLPEASFSSQVSFLTNWINEHIQDGARLLNKPVLFTEFGKSDKQAGYYAGERDRFLYAAYSTIYASAKNRGPGAGGLVWQLFSQGMSGGVWDDGFQIEVSTDRSTASIIAAQSRRMSVLNQLP